ncbi:hypothetical protein SAMN05421734_10429 [Pelagirhabdus alkalitolerans]|uniref:Tetratricopeptide repeat-containing protein n=1 Tax=Pelagirhabdus alkalitolerans TaxID=1612202 RepID=A0A1G6IGW8_9BACI|nr:hypothetical protein [Pelagirhabdus alkalitolerans]SDC05650.1 hypothetical protein SAMN05421734_10429 [Pelagirhabdus alkalitolerans]
MKCKIKSQKKVATLSTKGLAMYQHAKIVQAQGRSKSNYYLIFHKNRYINTIKADELKQNSFIKRAFDNGIVIHGDHPAIYELTNDSIFPCSKPRQVMDRSLKMQPNIEQLIILSYFDQVIDSAKIHNEFIKTARTFLQNGKRQKAYTALTLLLQMEPHHHYAKDMVNDVAFVDSHMKPEELEFYTPLDINRLKNLFKEQNRTLDYLILQTHRLTNRFSQQAWDAFLPQLKTYPTSVQRLTLLSMYKHKPALMNYEVFSDALLSVVTSDEYIKLVLHPTFNHSIEPKQFLSQLKQSSNRTKYQIFQKRSHSFDDRIQDFDNETKEIAIRIIIESLLDTTEIDTILEWIESKQDNLSYTGALQQIKQLQEDPDKQETLAELYKKFHAYSKAIACYKWVMDLDPTNEAVNKQLITLLKEQDQTEEAKAYQQQFIQLVKYEQ